MVEEEDQNKLVNGTKRKAEPHKDAPPAKKQQVKSRNDTNRFNSLPEALNNELGRHPPSKRESPESDASSVSEKPVTQEQIVEEAKRFHKYYTKYKDLHEKINKQRASDRKDEDVDLVWSMHKRLQEMKDRIWRDWTKVERMERT